LSARRLALFDCDGTLADSQHEILSAMTSAFAAIGLPPPPAQQVRTSIGLSLPAIAKRLLPDDDGTVRAALVDCYREAYFAARTAASAQPEPLYDGIVDVLGSLNERGWALGVATGKSRRGLDRLLAAHGIRNRFVTLQTSDVHPSKPHPAMVEAAAQEAGIAVSDIVVIGDTEFDISMAGNAGAHAIGVSWGYHDADILIAAGARAIAATPEDVPDLLDQCV
jgi:phosphoglycolate phosphatase